jgi:hypothetical protein
LKLPIKNNDAKNIRTLFLDKSTSYHAADERLNIVLSPSFYWFKKEVLPVKYASQAQSLVASQFDGVIPSGSYKYMVIKKEELFWLFAYDESAIAQKLKSLHIKPSQIEGFYLAQNEFSTMTTPLNVNENSVLVNNDGVISMMPGVYVKERADMTPWMQSLSLSKHKVNLNLFQNSVLDEKWIYRFSALSIVGIVLYLGSYLLLKNDLKQQLVKEYTLTQKYELPETSFQLNSLKRSLLSKEEQQIKFRENLKVLFSVPLSEGEYVTKFDVNEKTAQYEMVLNKPENAEIIKRSIEKKFKVISAKVVDKTFYLGVSL